MGFKHAKKCPQGCDLTVRDSSVLRNNLAYLCDLCRKDLPPGTNNMGCSLNNKDGECCDWDICDDCRTGLLNQEKTGLIRAFFKSQANSCNDNGSPDRLEIK